MSGKKGMKNYSSSFKEQAVRMHIEDGLTIREINERLGIADRQRLKKWCAAYRKEGLPGLQPQLKGRPKKISKTKETWGQVICFGTVFTRTSENSISVPDVSEQEELLSNYSQFGRAFTFFREFV